MFRVSLRGFSLVVSRNIFTGGRGDPPRVQLAAAYVPVRYAQTTTLLLWLGPVFFSVSVPRAFGRTSHLSRSIRTALHARAVNPDSLSILR